MYALRLSLYLIFLITTKAYWINFGFELSDYLVCILGFEASLISYTQNKNNRNQIEIQLFIDFNHRYNLINERLELIRCNGLNSIQSKNYDRTDESIIIDYINLCCEQYYTYRVKKFIPKSVWQFWHQGIMYWCETIPDILITWETEYTQNNSFYIKNNDHPFRVEANR